jgi:hypothetical protein
MKTFRFLFQLLADGLLFCPKAGYRFFRYGESFFQEQKRFGRLTFQGVLLLSVRNFKLLEDMKDIPERGKDKLTKLLETLKGKDENGGSP